MSTANRMTCGAEPQWLRAERSGFTSVYSQVSQHNHERELASKGKTTAGDVKPSPKEPLPDHAEQGMPVRIWLNVVPGTIVVAPDRLLFQCNIGEKSIACIITAEALDDILHFHRLDVSKDEAFDTLLKEIERTAMEHLAMVASSETDNW